jgi:shikimate O-hydroxycinnamoyltransferase
MNHKSYRKTKLPRSQKMTTIKASYTVKPSESTPKGRLWLTDLDQIKVLVRLSHSPLIFIYKPKQNTQNRTIIETLKTSLSKILVHYYPMAGRYCFTNGGRIELNLNAKGAVLIEAETTKTFHDYGDFSPDSTKELIPIIDYNQPMEEVPLFVAQVTRFQNKDESFGFAIAVSYSHTLSDAFGFFSLMNSWAKIARGENTRAFVAQSTKIRAFVT